MQGDLDWIVMKALEKDRNRRYETASDIAADVQRYLSDETVQACPPSAIYRYQKFARRNKAALLVVLLVAAAMLLGLAGTTWQLIRATRAERLTKVQRDRAMEAEKLAKSEADVAKAVNDFLNRDLLGQVGPYLRYDKFNESRDELKLVTVLDRAADQLEGRFADKPLVEAALRQTIGLTYLSFDEDKSRAKAQFQRAAELRRTHLGDEHPDTLVSMHDLALAMGDQDLVSQVLDVRRRVLGKHHRATMNTMYTLAMVARNQGENARAIELFRETLDAQRSALGEDDTHTAWTMHCLAHTLVMSAGDDGLPPAGDREIESLYRQALATYSKPSVNTTWQAFDITARLAEFLHARRRNGESETALQDALKRIRSLPGASPEKTAELTNLLESVYIDWGKPELAAELKHQRPDDKVNRELVKEVESFAEAIKLRPDRWEEWNGRAWAYFRLRSWDHAIADYSQAIKLAPEVHTNWHHRGLAYLEIAQPDKAAADFTKIADGWSDEPGGWYLRALAHAQLNQAEKAIADLRQAIARGYKDIDQIRTEWKLDPLRSNEEFKQLLTELTEATK